MLAEAAQVANTLRVLLKRAEFDSTSCTKLIRELGGHERSYLQKSFGRIEPRRRFKGHDPQPLLAHRMLHGLYIDECGKSMPEPSLGPTYFALGAVAMIEEDVASYRAAADRIKLEFFGKTDITFHDPYMREHDGPYYFGGNESRQREFDDAIDHLVDDTKCVVFGVGVRKWGFEREFVETGLDPYLPTDAYAVAISMLLERYLDYLAHCATEALGRITFESQGPKEDAEHQLEYARLLLEGTQWVSASSFRNWLETGLRFTPKSGSDPMELADMFSRDLYEWIRDGCQQSPKRWDLFSRKIYCRGDGMMGKFGVKVFPDSEVREHVEAHRIQCGAVPLN